jgi:arylsulfatase A-like enzyme
MKNIFTSFALFALFVVSSHASPDRPNVLMIIVDDLKPDIGAYGDTYAITPAMDRLASQGTVFLNNQCQQAVCGASRASALTGLRPDSTHVWDFGSRMRDDLPDLVTLPQYFKNEGYHTASIGKVFDPRCCDGGKTNDAASWSQPHWDAETPHLADNHFGDPETKRILEDGEARAREAGITNPKKIREFTNYFPTTECMDKDVPDNFYGDGKRADHAIELIGEFAKENAPFFLAVGFKKPHLPFVAPKKYWDLYDREEVPLAQYQQMPEGAPAYHFQDSWELRSGYAPIPEGILPEEMQRRMVHGYYACTSYIDTQVGRIMDALKEAGLDDNTVVVLWGDHGWHLGDHGMWCKHTNYEQAARAPLMIVDPRIGNPASKVTRATEFVDISPTLAELAGLPERDTDEGASLVPLMKDADAPFKGFAVSQFARSKGAANNLMGYAFRNERYRLILWIEMAFKSGERSGPLVDTELYDYETDPLETRNLAVLPENRELLDSLLAGARAFAAEHMAISWAEAASN